MRRTFRLSEYIGSPPKVLTVLSRESVHGAFNARFDLAQLVSDCSIPPGSSDDHFAAADHDFSGTVELMDMQAFMEHWNAGRAAADFNGDGQVNTLDLAAYMAAYGQ